jgi:micrococcal nuclease
MFEYNCTLRRVVDGDTIDVNIDLGFDIWHKGRIRMAGIDTPESRTRNKEEKVLGLAAKARLKELLKTKKLTIQCTKEKGKFGRILADVLANDVNINKQLMDEGHARPYQGGKKLPWV